MALNTHTYDPYYKEVFQSQILPNLPKLSNTESTEEWGEIMMESRKYPHDIQNLCFHVYRLHSVDMNVGGYSCNLLGSQVWKLIKNNEDAKLLLWNSLEIWQLDIANKVKQTVIYKYIMHLFNLVVLKKLR